MAPAPKKKKPRTESGRSFLPANRSKSMMDSSRTVYGLSARTCSGRSLDRYESAEPPRRKARRKARVKRPATTKKVASLQFTLEPRRARLFVLARVVPAPRSVAQPFLAVRPWSPGGIHPDPVGSLALRSPLAPVFRFLATRHCSSQSMVGLAVEGLPPAGALPSEVGCSPQTRLESVKTP